MSVYGLNQEGYPDPTAATAVANVSKAEKKYLPLVYICSKYSGDTVTNTEAAKQRTVPRYFPCGNLCG